MDLIILNDPANLHWQTNLYDLLMLFLFIMIVLDAVTQWRQGTRMWMFLLIASFVYGQVIELAGMATLNMYLQGDFSVMLDYPAISLFRGTTAMPSYVTIFYPVIFAIGYKVIENLGVESRVKAAITGGLFMVMLDAPYSIEGPLSHVVWWTYDPHFTMFEFWLGWPLVEMAWQAIWGAAFFYFVLRSRRLVDGPVGERATTVRLLALRAPLTGSCAIVAGSILMSPLIVTTLIGIPQWIMLSLLMIAYCAVAIPALRTAEPPRRSVDPWLACCAGCFTIAFAAMIIGNVVHEHGVTLYAVVQTLGLLGVLAFVTFPRWAPQPITTRSERISAARTSG